MPAQNDKCSTELETALEALKTYDNGGKRSTLLPLDAAVVQSLSNGSDRDLLVRQLTKLLGCDTPAPARQYICGKLALIGTADSVPHLARLLDDPKVAADARTALESMPDDAAAKALLAEVPRLTGLQRAGAISSLGVRCYGPAARRLRRELDYPDPLVQKAARSALSRIEGRI